MSGQIPTELGELAELESLVLRDNQLTRSIPDTLGDLANLAQLWLSQNELTGCIPLALRRVADNDLDDLALPYCDVLLSGLTVSPGSLVPAFDAYHFEYSASVGLSPVTVTLIPANEHNATFQFLDENDIAFVDADDTLEGFQVDFGADVVTVRIKVISPDNLANYTYTIVDLGGKYDDDDDGAIQRDEVISAIKDYFSDLITREEVIEVIKLYFSS